MFNNLGADYYGDQDEGDASLLEFEQQAEASGTSLTPTPSHILPIYVGTDHVF